MWLWSPHSIILFHNAFAFFHLNELEMKRSKSRKRGESKIATHLCNKKCSIGECRKWKWSLHLGILYAFKKSRMIKKIKKMAYKWMSWIRRFSLVAFILVKIEREREREREREKVNSIYYIHLNELYFVVI